jgi:hypothetical protein
MKIANTEEIAKAVVSFGDGCESQMRKIIKAVLPEREPASSPSTITLRRNWENASAPRRPRPAHFFAPRPRVSG